MKPLLSRRAMFAAVLGLTALAARPAMAQHTVFHFSAKGGYGFVEGVTTDPTTGYVTVLEIFVGESTNHQPGGPPQTTINASAFYFTYDPTTGNLIDEGSGDLTVNSALLPAGASKVDSASFNVSGDVTSFFTGDSYPVSADVTLTGTGAPITQSVHQRIKIPGSYTENIKSSGTFQFNANVSGTMSFNGITLDVIYGEFGFTKSYDVAIVK
jgi:hypothetical protein